MNGCEILKCHFWNGNKCIDKNKYNNENGEEVCGLRDDAVLEDK